MMTTSFFDEREEMSEVEEENLRLMQADLKNRIKIKKTIQSKFNHCTMMIMCFVYHL